MRFDPCEVLSGAQCVPVEEYCHHLGSGPEHARRCPSLASSHSLITPVLTAWKTSTQRWQAVCSRSHSHPAITLRFDTSRKGQGKGQGDTIGACYEPALSCATSFNNQESLQEQRLLDRFLGAKALGPPVPHPLSTHCLWLC